MIFIYIYIYLYIHIMDNMYMRPSVFVCFLRHSSRHQKNDRHLIGDFLELFGQLWILSAKLPCEAAFHAMPRHRLANLLLKKTAHEINCKIYVKKKRGGNKHHFALDLKDKTYKNTPWVFDHNKETLEDHNVEIWHDLSWGIDFFHTAEMPSFNRLMRLGKLCKGW